VGTEGEAAINHPNLIEGAYTFLLRGYPGLKGMRRESVSRSASTLSRKVLAKERRGRRRFFPTLMSSRGGEAQRMEEREREEVEQLRLMASCALAAACLGHRRRMCSTESMGVVWGEEGDD
jgi:hypothetical protein